MQTINTYSLKTWKAQFPTAIWTLDDAALAYKIGFADALGKKEEFEAKIKQMVFPTFFGAPAHTMISDDGGASFYFVIYLDKDLRSTLEGTAHVNLTPKEGAHFAMNGGMIFHPRYFITHATECEKEQAKLSGKDPYQHDCTCGAKEQVDYAGGSWSIHT